MFDSIPFVYAIIITAPRASARFRRTLCECGRTKRNRHQKRLVIIILTFIYDGVSTGRKFRRAAERRRSLSFYYWGGWTTLALLGTMLYFYLPLSVPRVEHRRPLKGLSAVSKRPIGSSLSTTLPVY